MSHSESETHPVIDLSGGVDIFDFTRGYDTESINEFIKKGGRAVGGYNENRRNMYLAPQYQNKRNIHMGIDFWAPAGEPVYSALDGIIAYKAFHNQTGNYGATIVLKHQWKGEDLFALYGHLSLKSLKEAETGNSVQAGDVVGWLGDESENGNWPPHLHYQLSRIDPGEADMPGVVSREAREDALKTYPDPRMILGRIY